MNTWRCRSALKTRSTLPRLDDRTEEMPREFNLIMRTLLADIFEKYAVPTIKVYNTLKTNTKHDTERCMVQWYIVTFSHNTNLRRAVTGDR